MKLQLPKQRTKGLTFVDVMVLLIVFAILAFLLLSVLAAAQRRSSRLNCVSNLKQVNLAFRIWEGDNNNKYPMAVSESVGGAMESVATGDVVTCFIVMSNELSTPKVLICPEDATHAYATNWVDDFNRSNVSYFVGADADEAHPERIMSGDDNFALGGVPIKSGLFAFATNAPIAWGTDRHDEVIRVPYLRIPLRHDYFGNLSFADGSVGEFYASGLQRTLVETGLATNRFAIP